MKSVLVVKRLTPRFPVAVSRGLPGVPGEVGAAARQPEMQASATHVQWRLVGDTAWQDLVPLADLQGEPGPTGPGVPDGGNTGQVLAKRSDVPQDTHWIDPPAGGGGGADAVGTVRQFSTPPDPELWVRGGTVLEKATHAALYAAVGDRYTRYTELVPESTTERGTSTTNRWVDYSPTLGLFAGIDNGGKATYSTDGVNWSVGVVTGFAASAVYKVVWLNDKFFAVGNNSLIATSDDGVNWTGQTIGSSILWNDVAWTGTNYVLVGSSGNLRTSATGLSWSTRTSAFSTTEIKQVLALADGKCVISGASAKVAYSVDHGVTWTIATSGGSGTIDNLIQLPVTGEVLALSTSTSGIRVSSDGGATWGLYGAVLPATGFVIVVYEGKVYATRAGVPYVLDPVALTWTETTDVPELVISRVIEVPSKNVQVLVTANAAFFSISGGAFKTTRYVVTTGNTIFSRAGGKLFAVCASTPGIAVSVDDGVTWERYLSATWSSGNSRPVIFENGGVYLYHGAASQLWRSTDGFDWRRVQELSMSANNGACVAVAGGAFYAISAGTLYTSVDGLSWTVVSLPFTGGDAPVNLVGIGDVLVLIASTGMMYRREGAAGSWEVFHSVSGISSMCATADGLIAGSNSSYGSPLLIDPTTMRGVSFGGAVGSSATAIMPMSDALGSGANDNSTGGQVSFDNGASWHLLPLPPLVEGGAVVLVPGKGSRFLDIGDGVVVATNYCLVRYKTTIPGTHFAAPWAPPGYYVRAKP